MMHGRKNTKKKYYILHIWTFHYSDCLPILWKVIVPSYTEFSPAKKKKPCEPGGHSSCASRYCCSCTYRPLSIGCEFMKRADMLIWHGRCWDNLPAFFSSCFPHVWRHRPVHHIWRSVCILQVKSLPTSPLPFTHTLSLSLPPYLSPLPPPSGLYCLLRTTLRTPLSFSSFILSATDFPGD